MGGQRRNRAAQLTPGHDPDQKALPVNCGTCPYWRRHGDLTGTLGLCIRRPPAPVPGSISGGGLIGKFPVSSVTDLCGEHPLFATV
jgi:hypothetical protein